MLPPHLMQQADRVWLLHVKYIDFKTMVACIIASASFSLSSAPTNQQSTGFELKPAILIAIVYPAHAHILASSMAPWYCYGSIYIYIILIIIMDASPTGLILSLDHHLLLSMIDKWRIGLLYSGPGLAQPASSNIMQLQGQHHIIQSVP